MSPSPAATVAIGLVLSCCATIAVGFRVHVRKRRGMKLALDDWTSLLSLVLAWCFAAVLFTGVGIGVIGHHTSVAPTTDHDLTQRRKATKALWAAQLLMPLTYGMIKLSVLFLYQRIFLGKYFRIYSIAMCCLIASWALAFFFAFAFQCGTNPGYWWTSIETITKYCDNDKQSNLAFAISDTLTDLMVLATPLPILWRLQMGKGEKIGLSVIFMLGLLSTAAAIVRMAYIIVNDWLTTLGHRDLLALDTIDLVWGFIEASVGVIAACLPCLKPLVHGRSPETILRSLRSKVSLYSSTTPTKRQSYEHDMEKLAKSGKTENSAVLPASAFPSFEKHPGN